MWDRVADIVLVGSGLGATAAARHLASAGASVVLVPGIGRTRFPHLDGGVIDPAIIQEAFGQGAPLGGAVAGRQELRLADDGRFEIVRTTAVSSMRTYRRHLLETWATNQATAAGALFLDDFIEGKVLPNPDGSMTLTSERNERTIRARTIVLCEGADPRIPMRVKLRPDYGPEDQIHFARTVLHGVEEGVVRYGGWVTSWGMPVGIDLVPQPDGVIVSVSARIENVMRCGRSSKDALEDFLQSTAFASLGVQGERGETGVELVALRRDRRNMAFMHDRLLMGIDASGVIDARGEDRASLTIRSGLRLASWLTDGPAAAGDWDAAARTWIDATIPPGSTYHDDRVTGFLEEATSGMDVGLPRVLARWIRPRRTSGRRAGNDR